MFVTIVLTLLVVVCWSRVRPVAFGGRDDESVLRTVSGRGGDPDSWTPSSSSVPRPLFTRVDVALGQGKEEAG